MDVLRSSVSLSPSGRSFDRFDTFDLQQNETSTSPPPAPGPYTPTKLPLAPPQGDVAVQAAAASSMFYSSFGGFGAGAGAGAPAAQLLHSIADAAAGAEARSDSVGSAGRGYRPLLAPVPGPLSPAGVQGGASAAADEGHTAVPTAAAPVVVTRSPEAVSEHPLGPTAADPAPPCERRPGSPPMSPPLLRAEGAPGVGAAAAPSPPPSAPPSQVPSMLNALQELRDRYAALRGVGATRALTHDAAAAADRTSQPPDSQPDADAFFTPREYAPPPTTTTTMAMAAQDAAVEEQAATPADGQEVNPAGMSPTASPSVPPMSSQPLASDPSGMRRALRAATWGGGDGAPTTAAVAVTTAKAGASSDEAAKYRTLQRELGEKFQALEAEYARKEAEWERRLAAAAAENATTTADNSDSAAGVAVPGGLASERERYRTLQKDLAARFETLQRETAAREATYRDELDRRTKAAREDALREKAAEFQKLHGMLQTQQHLIEEQLKELAEKEADVSAREAQLSQVGASTVPPVSDVNTPPGGAQDDPHPTQVVQGAAASTPSTTLENLDRITEDARLNQQRLEELAAWEARLAAKESTFIEREAACARLEKQQLGLLRMARSASQRTAVSNTATSPLRQGSVEGTGTATTAVATDSTTNAVPRMGRVSQSPVDGVGVEGRARTSSSPTPGARGPASLASCDSVSDGADLRTASASPEGAAVAATVANATTPGPAGGGLTHEEIAVMLGQVATRETHAAALFKAASRKEAAVRERTKAVEAREQVAAVREKELKEKELVLDLATAEVLKAASTAEMRAVSVFDARLGAQLTAADRRALCGTDVPGAINADVAARAAQLQLWEQEVEAARLALHTQAVAARGYIEGTSAGAATPPSPATPAEASGEDTTATPRRASSRSDPIADARAAITAAGEKEARWVAFLTRAMDHGSLEAQRFVAAERDRALAIKADDLLARQQRVNEDRVRVSKREVAVEELENRAREVLTRLDTAHGSRASAEKTKTDAMRLEQSLAQRAVQLDNDQAALNQRSALLREKERRFEQRQRLLEQMHPRGAQGAAATAPLAPALIPSTTSTVAAAPPHATAAVAVPFTHPPPDEPQTRAVRTASGSRESLRTASGSSSRVDIEAAVRSLASLVGLGMGGGGA